MAGRLPKPLNPGDTLGVCAPSGAVPLDRFDQGVTVLLDMGFHVVVSGGVYEKKRYLAGDDLRRARDLNDLFADPGIDGIVCARGGFGALRMLAGVDYSQIMRNPKRLAGFSDSTALLTAIQIRTGLAVIHGPVVTSLADAGSETLASLFRALTSDLDGVIAKADKIIVRGAARGILTGGNLATLSHLTGTPFQPDCTGAVVFLEDVSEPPYKIDRMLTHMKLAGVFDGIAGIVTGSFENCGSLDEIHEIVSEIFMDMEVPVMAGVASGHGPVNLSLPFGIDVAMDTESLTVRSV
ncbi:MAG: LD-carboxypeptidase [Pseudomonadota bacterium]